MTSDTREPVEDAARLMTGMRRRPRLQNVGMIAMIITLLLMGGLIWGIGGAFNGILRLANEARNEVVPRINKQQEYAVFAARMGQLAEQVLGARKQSVRAEALREAESLFGRFAADADPSVLRRLNEALTAVRRTAARADAIDALRGRVEGLRRKADDVFVHLLGTGTALAAQEPYFRLLKVLDETATAPTLRQVEALQEEFRLFTATARVALATAEGPDIDRFFTDLDSLEPLFALRRRMLGDESQMIDEIRRTHAALNELSASLNAGAASGTVLIADTLTEHAENGLVAIVVGLGATALAQLALFWVLRRHVLTPVGRAAAALAWAQREKRQVRLEPASFAELDDITAGVERFSGALVELHEQAEALRVGEERLRTILACSPFPIVIARRSDGSVLYFNWQAELLFGTEGERLTLTRDSRFFVDPDDADMLFATIDAEGMAREVEARLISNDGVEFWAMLSAVMIRDDDDQAILVAINDITQRRESEQETAAARERAERALRDLQQAQESLIQAEKMASLGGLVAGIAHEVNTPVGSALTGITYLADHTRSVAQRFNENALKRADFADHVATATEACALIEANLHRAAELIQSFKQTAVDQTSEERRRFELGAYLQDVFTSLHPRLRKGGHAVRMECPPGLEIDGYPGALFQVLTNFTMNALTHAYPEEGRGGTLTVTAERISDDEVELRFADDGRGIAAANKARIFEPFFTTRRGSGGCGLGLHIVYNIVSTSLGGTIRVESEEGRGTTFIVRFPVVAPRPAPVTAERGLESAPSAATA